MLPARLFEEVNYAPLISFVDDQVEVLQLLSHIAEHLGYEVRTAQTASQAMFVAKEFNPNVVIIDFDLPDLGGIELTRGLVAILERVRVVMTSGHAWLEDKLGEEARKAGVGTFIAKPFSVTDIEDAIQGTMSP